MGFDKLIEDFPDYAISSDGEVKKKYTNEFKAVRVNNQGDVMIDLSRDGRAHTRKLSLLVARAYLEEPPEYFNSVIHHDGDKTNCSAVNLSWRPRWFVVEYNRMFTQQPYNVSVYHSPSGEEFGTLREACIKYGLIEWRAYDNIYNGSPIFPLKYGDLHFL